MLIGKSVCTIGLLAFDKTISLSTIKVDSGNPKYDSRDNCNAIVESGTNSLIVGCKNTVIPNSVTTIGEYAFYHCSGLTSIAIPGSVTTIGKWAFFGCNGLLDVTIPHSVTEIGNWAFSNCSSLDSIFNHIDHPTDVKLGGFVFAGVPTSTCKLYVNKGRVNEYREADQWKDFVSILEIEEACGDINGDGQVDVTDVDIIIDMVLGKAEQDLSIADLDKNGMIDVTDVGLLIDIILGK